MTNFIRISALIAGASLLTLAACSTASPAKEQNAHAHAKHQGMDGKHEGMMQQMKADHEMMSKMDMSKMDMSKLSPECQTMMTKMKTKMADKHKSGNMDDHHKTGMKGHDMSKMKNHDSASMQAKMEKHKQCMAEMKEAMPHGH